MTQPPFNNLRLKPGEQPTADRLGDLLDGIALNFETLFEKFPVQGSEVGNAFLRLAVSGSHKVNWGTTELEWNGAGPASNTKEITHGLGIVPAHVDLTFDSLITVAGNAQLFAFGVERTSSTIFKVNATLPTGSIPAAGTKVKFSWTAIG